ncbi:hypothetical protein BKA62DRAFT_709074 [Auriculariales sp. MPI-PUGE-AT-0066]|nr:hypothetical protein BKA62DRAFT_709074 [Auriculariales sp. MPI-PUGE-AT-0066]
MFCGLLPVATPPFDLSIELLPTLARSIVSAMADNNNTASTSATASGPVRTKRRPAVSVPSSTPKLPPPCAECKRLKLKCDRNVPCGPCIKNQRTDICPDGKRDTGQMYERKLMLADNRRVRDHVAAMQERIRALETAIHALRGPVDLAKESTVEGRVEPASNLPRDLEHPLERVVKSMGTLALGDDGDFIGGYASSDVLMLNLTSNGDALKPSLVTSSHKVCDDGTVLTRETASLSLLASYLPSREAASDLVQCFSAHGAWLVSGLYGVDVWKDIFEPIYDFLARDPRLTQPDELPDDNAYYPSKTPTATDMALLFSILAIGVFFDDDVEQDYRPPDATLAAWYASRARLGLAVDDVLAKPTFTAIRVLHCQTWLMHFLTVAYPPARRAVFTLQGLSSQMCKSLDLNFDDARLAINDDERQQRRALCWDVVTSGAFVAFSHGYAPTLSSRQVDNPLPDDPSPYVTADGRCEDSFYRFVQRFARDVILSIIHTAFGVRPASYATILRLDRKVRDFPWPSHLQISADRIGLVPDDDNMGTVLEIASAVVFSRVALLYIHRPYFAAAMSDFSSKRAVHSNDPLASPHRESVLATFRASIEITTTMRSMESHPPTARLCRRLTWFWSAMFSSCVVLAAMVIRYPGSTLAGTAWDEVRQTVDTLEALAATGDDNVSADEDNMSADASEARIGMTSVRRMLPSLRKLRDKANSAMIWASGHSQQVADFDLDETEEAFIFGRAHFIRPPLSTESQTASLEATAERTPPGLVPPFLFEDINAELFPLGAEHWAIDAYLPPTFPPVYGLFAENEQHVHDDRLHMAGGMFGLGL